MELLLLNKLKMNKKIQEICKESFSVDLVNELKTEKVEQFINLIKENKNIKYNKFIYDKYFKDNEFNVANIAFNKDKNEIYYAESKYLFMKKQDSIFIKNKSRKGFTYNIDTKKFRVWFGQKVTNLNYNYINLVLDYFKFDFIKKENLLILFKTNTMFKALFDGKINNPTDVCKKYISLQRWKNCSPELFRLALKVEQSSNSTFYFQEIYNIFDNFNYILSKIIANNSRNIESIFKIDNNTYFDLVHQLKILGYKLNPKWSSKRILEQHNKYTQELMEYELLEIKDKNSVLLLDSDYLKLKEKLTNLGFTFLDNNIQTFKIGKQEKHCIYTNYWSKIELGKYLAMIFDSVDGLCTIGIDCQYMYKKNEYQKEYEITYQIYHKYNKIVKSAITDDIISILKPFTENFINILTKTRNVEKENLTELDF